MLYKILQTFPLILAFQGKLLQPYISVHTLQSKSITVFTSFSNKQELVEKAFATSVPRSRDSLTNGVRAVNSLVTSERKLKATKGKQYSGGKMEIEESAFGDHTNKHH